MISLFLPSEMAHVVNIFTDGSAMIHLIFVNKLIHILVISIDMCQPFASVHLIVT